MHRVARKGPSGASHAHAMNMMCVRACVRVCVCVAGKMITVVVPDELQPGDVLAVPSPTPSHPAQPPLQRTPLLNPPPSRPRRGLDGGPPCSHAHPPCAAQADGETALRTLPMLTVLSMCAGHRAAQAQGEAERRGSEAAGHSGAGRAAAAAAAEPRLGGRRRSSSLSGSKRDCPFYNVRPTRVAHRGRTSAQLREWLRVLFLLPCAVTSI